MIKILILEDEIPARKKLKRFIGQLDQQTQVVAEIDTIANAIEFLNITKIDLIFSDIELFDGNAFEIYKQVSISCPIIFTTAYDQFWMNAFDGNGIDYLLKPFSKDRFNKSWDKFLMLRNSPNDSDDLLNNIMKIIEENLTSKTFKKRFIVQNRKNMYFLDTQNICCFEANEGVIFAHETLNKKHLLTETTLKEIEGQLDPLDFFRLNRSVLINRSQIEKIESYSKNSLAVKLKNFQKHFITSQSNTPLFRDWIKL